MPRGDGTGPMGMGSMTGRGTGYCVSNASPVFVNRGVGFGRGMGGGRGFKRMLSFTEVPGWMRNDYSAVTPNGQIFDEKAVLKNQEELFKNQ